MSEEFAESLKRKHEEDETPETVKRKVVKPDEWVDAWKRNSIGFHEGVPNSMLVKYLDKLFNGRSSITIFVPLCGKAVDMKFLYDAGHTVVGVEVAEQALRDFFTENNMEYTVEKDNKSNASVYKSSDQRIRLYCMDLYDFTRDVESDMQAIWDRASLIAINQEDRAKYVDLLVTLMAEDCRYLLQTFHYDEEKFAGPPHSLPPKAVNELFKDKCNITEIETADLDDEGRKTRWNLKELYESLFLITPKILGKTKPESNIITERTMVDNEGWLEKWNKSDIVFHQGVPNKMLVQHLDKLVNGKSAITIFFPLCGKAVDMKFVYDAGHTVVGVEVVEQAVQEFFTENELEYTVEKLDKIKGSLYKSSDGRIRLYCADLFDFSSELENAVQAIWDRASLVAVNVVDRKKYADLMTSLMSDDCQYLLLAYNYDKEKYAGPPHAVDNNVVHQLFGERCNIKRIDGGSIFDPAKHGEKFGLDWFEEDLYVITLKS